MEFELDMFLAQIVNFAIIFWIYKKFLATHIVEMIENRRTLIDKLENADAEYNDIINEAKTKADELISQGVDKKNQLIAQAGAVADNKNRETIDNAKKQADLIIRTATEKSKLMEQELEYNFADSVKKTTQVVVNKLLKKDANLEQAYLDQLITEAKK